MPAVGVILGTLLAAAPFKDVYRAFQDHHLGEINPIPFAMLTGSTSAGMWYAVSIQDYFFFWANATGAVFSLWYTLVSVSCVGGQKVGVTLMRIMLFNLCFQILIYMVAFISFQGTTDVLQTILGINFFLFLAAFFLSPLSTIFQVFRTKDSSTLILSLGIMFTINGVVWTSYGLALDDVFIFGPHIFAIFIGILQVFCCFKYPRITELQKKEAMYHSIKLPDIDGVINYAPPMLESEAMREIEIRMTDIATGAVLDTRLAAKDVLQAVGLALLQPPKLEADAFEKMQELLDDDVQSLISFKSLKSFKSEIEMSTRGSQVGFEIPLDFMPNPRYLDEVNADHQESNLEVIREMENASDFVMEIPITEETVPNLERILTSDGRSNVSKMSRMSS